MITFLVFVSLFRYVNEWGRDSLFFIKYLVTTCFKNFFYIKKTSTFCRDFKFICLFYFQVIFRIS